VLKCVFVDGMNAVDVLHAWSIQALGFTTVVKGEELPFVRVRARPPPTRTPTDIEQPLLKVYDELMEPCRKIARGRGFDHGEAHDIAMEALLHLQQAFLEGVDIRDVGAYLRGILRNKIVHRHKRLSFESPRDDWQRELADWVSETKPHPESQAAINEKARAVDRALVGMEPRLRQVFLLRSLGASCSELEKWMALSQFSGSRLINKAIGVFKERLAEEGFDPRPYRKPLSAYRLQGLRPRAERKGRS
jgi:RNA polymerase sigma factor (sigma-70 family)